MIDVGGYNIDTNRKSSELLKEIAEHAGIANRDKSAAIVAPSIATLLVKLSEDADKQANIIRWLTKVICGLTIVITILTAVLVCIEVYKIVDQNHEHNEAAEKQQKKESTMPAIVNILPASPSVNGKTKKKHKYPALSE